MNEGMKRNYYSNTLVYLPNKLEILVTEINFLNKLWNILNFGKLNKERGRGRKYGYGGHRTKKYNGGGRYGGSGKGGKNFWKRKKKGK